MDQGGVGNDIEPVVCPAAQPVGNHDLLIESRKEEAESDQQMAVIMDAVPDSAELRHHFLVVNYRPCQKMGEKTDKQRIIEEDHIFTVFLYASTR